MSIATLPHRQSSKTAPAGLEYKACDCKTEVGESGSLVAYVSVFSNIDHANEKIAPNAFSNLDAFEREGFLAVNHDWSALPIATIKSASQDNFGLKIQALFHGTPEAQAARVVMKERKERGRAVRFSIGYRVDDDA